MTNEPAHLMTAGELFTTKRTGPGLYFNLGQFRIFTPVLDRISAQRMVDDAVDFIYAKDGDMPPPCPGPPSRPSKPAYPPDWSKKVLPRRDRERLARRRLRDAKSYGMKNVPTLQDIIDNPPPWRLGRKEERQ